MKSAIFIKNLKKFKNYNLSLDNGMKNVLLSGEDPKSEEKSVEITPHPLVQATRKLGKKLYNIILKELEKRTNEIDRALNSKTPIEKTYIDKNIKEYVSAFNENKNKNYSHYKVAFEFYSEAYRLLEKENKKNVSVTNNPRLINIQLKELEDDRYWGIEFSDSHSGWNIKRAYEDVFSKLIQKMDSIDCISLLDKVDYMLYDIRYLFSEIFVIKENSKNEHTTEIYVAIKEWCEQFGMPFWTDRESIAPHIMNKITFTGEVIDNFSRKEIKKRDDCKSLYELSENTVPIINLISISLSIYLFSELWKNYIKSEKNAKDKKKQKTRKNKQGLKRIEDKEEKLKYILATIGLNPILDKSITNLISDADKYHNYIMNKFNSIYDLKLNIYEKKIPYKKDNKVLFYNAKEYESTAIAAWDVFYHDYLGNSEITKPLPYCNECHKQIPEGQRHPIETKDILCDECYAVRKKELGRLRTQKCREKKEM